MLLGHWKRQRKIRMNNRHLKTKSWETSLKGYKENKRKSYKETLISCSWRTVKPEKQEQDLIITAGVLKSLWDTKQVKKRKSPLPCLKKTQRSPSSKRTFNCSHPEFSPSVGRYKDYMTWLSAHFTKGRYNGAKNGVSRGLVESHLGATRLWPQMLHKAFKSPSM